MHIALMGTRGLPPRYGGFETAVDEIGRRLVERGHEVTVYCRNSRQKLKRYEGMRLVNVPCVRHRVLETLSHTGLSAVHAAVRARPDVVFLFNAANAPFVPLLHAAGLPVAVHVDGLESKRGKWKGAGAAYYRRAEAWSVRWADTVIADARAIGVHLEEQYGTPSAFIPYGAAVVNPGTDRLAEHGLQPRGYHLVVARFEPENNVDLIVEGYVRSGARLPLVVVGSAPYNDEYTQAVHAAATTRDDVRLLGAVWDQHLLDQLYAGSASYVHGHSVGGTNPSLLRAMGAGASVVAFDVVFNREVTDGHALFFTGRSDLGEALVQVEADPDAARDRAEAGRDHVKREYSWDDVTTSYEVLGEQLVQGRRRGRA